MPDMRAIEITQPGGPEVLQLTTRPRPEPLAGQVVIRVAYAGVNRPDALQRAGNYAPPPDASDLPGLEASGEVVAVGEGVSWPGFAAMVLGVAGVLLLSDPPKVEGEGLRALLTSRAVVLGLTSGIFFGVSAVTYRGATLEVSGEPMIRALVALTFVLAIQIAALGTWLKLREPGEITRVAKAWKRAMWIGLTSLGGSICWFTAFTLENAGYVFAVGQLEVILSLAASVFFFRETVTRREVFGITLIFLSVVALIAVT